MFKENISFISTMLVLAMLIFNAIGCGGGGGGSDGDASNNYPADSIVNEPLVATTSSQRITKLVFTGDRSATYNFTYDLNGFLTKIENAADSTYYITFTFNSDGYLTQRVDGDGAGDVATITYTYNDGKLLSRSINNTESGQTETYSFNQWNGYFPTHASFNLTGGSDAFSGTWMGTVNSNGQFTNGLWENTSGGDIFRRTVTYNTSTVRDLFEVYSGAAWANETDCTYTYDSNGRQTKNELIEYESDGSYEIKTLEYTYNSDGNISSITVTRRGYNSSGVLQSTKIYTGTITYTPGSSRPAPNDILYRRYDSFIEYAVEALD